jgi:hypothetical protein
MSRLITAAIGIAREQDAKGEQIADSVLLPPSLGAPPQEPVLAWAFGVPQTPRQYQLAFSFLSGRDCPASGGPTVCVWMSLILRSPFDIGK